MRKYLIQLKYNFTEDHMRAICIIGSPRSNGSTGFIIDKIIEGMKDVGINSTRYCMGKMDIKMGRD